MSWTLNFRLAPYKNVTFKAFCAVKIEKLKSSPETGSILFFEQSNIYSGVQKCLYLSDFVFAKVCCDL